MPYSSIGSSRGTTIIETSRIARPPACVRPVHPTLTMPARALPDIEAKAARARA